MSKKHEATETIPAAPSELTEQQLAEAAAAGITVNGTVSRPVTGMASVVARKLPAVQISGAVGPCN